MPTYVAMLRGVNVGQKFIKMDRLRMVLQELGFSGVRTYIQSGNAVFKATKGSSASLAKNIEARILNDFGFEVSVFLKTSKEMQNIVEANPFVGQKGIDQSKLHATFMCEITRNASIADLAPLAAQSERFQVLNQEVYLYCPDGYGRTKLSNSAIERKLSVVATTRNWRTVNTLLAMAQS